MIYIFIVIIFVGLLISLHFYNLGKYSHCDKYYLYDQVDSYILSGIDTYDNSGNKYNYILDNSNMPLGRASAFLNFFGKTIYSEEPYLFLCNRSSIENEFREYGCIIARTGVYFSNEKTNVDSKSTDRAKQKELSFIGLTQIYAIGSFIILVNVRPKRIIDKIRIINVSDKQLRIMIRGIGKIIICNNLGLCLAKGQVVENFDWKELNEAIENGIEYKGNTDLNLELYEQIINKAERKLKRKRDAIEVENNGTIAGFSKFKTFFGELKNHMDGSRGHGYAAEYTNNTFDRALGKEVENAAQNLDERGKQVKYGADRIVNGVEIQTKYYKTALETIGSVFKNKEAIYIRNDGTGKMMQIEVPRNQYQEALQAMQKRIDSGQVPNVEMGETARDYVRKGFFTYEQSYNVARAGTIESLSVDLTSGAVCCVQAAGISALIIFAQAIWRGEPIANAARESLKSSLIVLGKGTLIYTMTMQLSRKEVANIFAGKIFTADGISQGYKAINNPIYDLSGKMADSFSKTALANSGAGKKLGLNSIAGRQIIANTATVVVVFGPDIVKTLQGRISIKQLFKNSVIGAFGMVGAVIGQTIIPIPIVGAMVGGTVSGFVTKKILDNYIEDDAKEMFRVLKEEFIDQTMLANLSHEEFDGISKLTVGHKKIAKILQNMYQSGEERRYAREVIMVPAIIEITKERARISCSEYNNAVLDVVATEI